MAWAVILGSYFCVSTDWQKEVERVMARLAVDKQYRQGLRDDDSEYAYIGDYEAMIEWHECRHSS